jgi:hypothetical protein
MKKLKLIDYCDNWSEKEERLPWWSWIVLAVVIGVPLWFFIKVVLEVGFI